MMEFNHEHPCSTNPLLLPKPSSVIGPVMFDVETDGLHPDDGARVSVISLAFRVEDEDQPVSVAYPFGQGPDSSVKFFDKLPDDDEWRGKHDLGQRAWRHLTRWLNSAGAGLVGHNIKFDILQMNGQAVPGYPGVDLTERVLFDTMVMAAEVWPRGPLALKKIATQLWGLDADEEQRALAPYLGRKTDPRFDQVPWPVMFEYARRDAELTMMVFEQMATELYESTALGRFLPMEMDVNRALIRMEVAGLPYDPEMSRDFARAIDARMEEIQAQLPFNVKPNDIKKFFFSTEPNPSAPDPTRPGLGLEPIETTPTGQPKMTAPIVDRMAAQGVPYTRELREYNRLKSANSKWYYPFADRAGADGRIRTSFRHTGGTKSGRFSASRINLQAVPKDYALQLPVPTPRQVVASAVRDLPADWGLFDLDLEQAELRVAALYAGCEPMLEHIREGRDLHGETATQLFGVQPGDADWDMYRSIAKRANFAQPVDELIATPGGPVPMGQLTPGDYVLGADGTPTQITDIPYKGVCDEYLVTTSDGRTTRCSPDHLWLVQNRDCRSKWRIVRTEELSDPKSTTRWYIPPAPVQEYAEQNLPVDPYILGVLLGDGSYHTTPYFRILTEDSHIADEVERRLPPGDTLVRTVYPDRPNMTRYSIHGGGVMQGLRDLGLVLGYKRPVTGADKFVPDVYLRGSVQQRLDLLRGLMDTDGTATKGGYVYNNDKGTVGAACRFYNTAPRLVDAVHQITHTLGGRAVVRWREPANDRCKPSAVVSVLLSMCPFNLPRKAQRWTTPKTLGRVEITFERTGRMVAQQCISVAAEDSLYSTAQGIVTHNSLQFGSGPVSFHEMLSNQAGLDLPMREVRRIVYDWRDLYPEFGAAIESAQGVCERFGFVEGLLGRRRYYGRDEDAHSAFNQVVQSSLATYAKMWTLSTDRLCRELDLPARGRRDGVGRGGLLLVVHDSQVLLLPNAEHESIVGTICQTASDIWDEAFPGVPGGADWERWA